VASRAVQHGIRSVPAAVIDGKLAGCCAGRGVDERELREVIHPASGSLNENENKKRWKNEPNP
jgi:hypothetical protein